MHTMTDQALAEMTAHYERVSKENADLVAELDALTDSAQEETARFEVKLEALTDTLDSLADQARRVQEADQFPSINKADELAKLLDMIREARG